MEINKIVFTANSKLDIISDICAICQEKIIDKCNKCLVDQSIINCYSIIGKCNHAYHYCCISNWLLRNPLNQKCPMCNQKWEIKKK